MQKLDNKTIARIMMHRACNYTYDEISDELGVSVTTVRKYLRNFESDAKAQSPELVFSQVMRHLLMVGFDE